MEPTLVAIAAALIVVACIAACAALLFWLTARERRFVEQYITPHVDLAHLDRVPLRQPPKQALYDHERHGPVLMAHRAQPVPARQHMTAMEERAGLAQCAAHESRVAAGHACCGIKETIISGRGRRDGNWM